MAVNFKKYMVVWLVTLLLSTASLVALVTDEKQPDALLITAMDVGQGDALLLRHHGRVMVVDGGPGSAVLDQMGKVMPWGKRSIDVLVVTHGDADHLSGALLLFDYYHVRQLVFGGHKNNAAAKALLQKAQAQGTNIIHMQKGQSFGWNNLRATMLWPDQVPKQTEQTNENSVILRVDLAGQPALLLTGDIEKETEAVLTRNHVWATAGILKAPHHGSKTSSSETFLNHVRPERVILSVGADNRYGHPSQEVLSRYHDRQYEVFRTDQWGALTITCQVENGTLHCLP